MKLSILPVLGAGLLAAASPMRDILVSSSSSSQQLDGPVVQVKAADGDPVATHYDFKPVPVVNAAEYKENKAESTYLDTKLIHQLPLVGTPLHVVEGTAPVVAHVHEGAHHPDAHGRFDKHGKRPSFLQRVHFALMSLGPWEGRAVAFVLGCGIGVLVRMLWVLGLFGLRAVRSFCPSHSLSSSSSHCSHDPFYAPIPRSPDPLHNMHCDPSNQQSIPSDWEGPGLIDRLPDNAPLTKVRPQGPADSSTNPEAILVLPGHKMEVFVCAFNPVHQSVLVTGSKDAVVNVWDLPYPPPKTSPEFGQPPGPPRRLEHFGSSDQGDLTALHWNHDGTLVAIGSYDAVLRVCTAQGDLYFSHTQHQGPIFAVRFSKDGKWLLTASLDGTACLWNVPEKSLQMQYRAHTDCCLDVDWLSDTTFGSCSADQLIHIMQVDKQDPIKTFSGHTNEVNQIKCNPSGTRLASCSDDMTARIWKIEGIAGLVDVGGPDPVIVLAGHKHSVSTIGWCPDCPAGTNEIIATSSFDGTARLWDSVTGECLQVFSDHKRPVYALKFNPTGRYIATGSGDGWLHVYDVKDRDLVWSWFAGFDKPGVFEIDWQMGPGLDRIALALECRAVAVIDVGKVPALQTK